MRIDAFPKLNLPALDGGATGGIAPGLPGGVGPGRPAGIGSDESRAGGFANAVMRAINQVDAQQHAAAAAATRFVKGEDDSIAGALLAAEQADLSFRFALQVRNKVVEAYQEIMRMQV